MTARSIRFGFFTVLLALFAAEGAVAQDPAAAPPADGMNEGVSVHGHWTISIVRDGEVVERREFENALLNGGATQISMTLAGERTPGLWGIAIYTSTSLTAPLCDTPYSLESVCRLREPDDVTVSTPDPNITLLLEGSAGAQADAELTRVTTAQTFCGPDIAPADCTTTENSDVITGTTLSSPISVQNGDVIQVTVELSFN